MGSAVSGDRLSPPPPQPSPALQAPRPPLPRGFGDRALLGVAGVMKSAPGAQGLGSARRRHCPPRTPRLCHVVLARSGALLLLQNPAWR